MLGRLLHVLLGGPVGIISHIQIKLSSDAMTTPARLLGVALRDGLLRCCVYVGAMTTYTAWQGAKSELKNLAVVDVHQFRLTNFYFA